MSVTLTPEEARIVRWLLMYWGADDQEARAARPPSRESIQALAARLEAAPPPDAPDDDEGRVM